MSKNNKRARVNGYREGYCEASLSKKAVAIEPADLLSLVPYAGGGLHGAVKPAKGANRFETSAVGGMGGMGGGAIGTGLGALAGAGINHFTGAEGSTANAIMALATLAGASGGTAVGSQLGRTMVARDTATPKELADIIRASAATHGNTTNQRG